MRRTGDQTISEEVTNRRAESTARIRDLSARFAPATRQIDLAEATRKNRRLDQDAAVVILEAEDPSSPIELVTENGFSITRPWEFNDSPAPANGSCRFRVTDLRGNERDVRVEISKKLIAESAFHTCGRIQPSSSFWICCAERHLAEYVWEHDAFPDGDSLIVETLDSEEVILAQRWRRSETG